MAILTFFVFEVLLYSFPSWLWKFPCLSTEEKVSVQHWHGFVHIAFIMIDILLLCLVCSEFLINEGALNSIKGFFCIHWDDQEMNFFTLCKCCIKLIDLHIFELPLDPWNEPTWLRCMVFCFFFFNVLNQSASILLGTFTSTPIKVFLSLWRHRGLVILHRNYVTEQLRNAGIKVLL